MKINFKMDVNISIKGRCRKSTNEVADKELLNVLNEQIVHLTKQRSDKTIANYHTALRSLFNFAETDTKFKELDIVFVERYEYWLKGRGVVPNTISCYMRSLRTLWRHAAANMKVDTECPFKNVFTGNAKTRKRSITAEDLRKLQQLSLPQGTFDALSRDIFLFSFYALGMPFVDAAHLRHSNISEKTIFYYRRKTGLPVKVRLEPCMVTIINQYRYKDSDWVFPLSNHIGDISKERNYQLALNRYNRTLKRLAQMAHIDCALTSYVVRHTWASVAFSSNVELPVISRALGHTNTDTTLIYIRDIDDNRLDEANRMLLDNIGV